jgi:hypothetical protein
MYAYAAPWWPLNYGDTCTQKKSKNNFQDLRKKRRVPRKDAAPATPLPSPSRSRKTSRHRRTLRVNVQQNTKLTKKLPFLRFPAPRRPLPDASEHADRHRTDKCTPPLSYINPAVHPQRPRTLEGRRRDANGTRTGRERDATEATRTEHCNSH